MRFTIFISALFIAAATNINTVRHIRFYVIVTGLFLITLDVLDFLFFAGLI